MAIISSASDASALPSTICPSGTGEVSSNWSVRIRFSSANRRIVKSGAISISGSCIPEKSRFMLALIPCPMLMNTNTKPDKSAYIVRNTYPTGVVK